MKTIIYSKITNLPCGEGADGSTPQYEILRSAIPSFGGKEEDYGFIEADEKTYKKLSDYHFTIVDGEIVFGEKKIKEDQPQEPTPEERIKALEEERLGLQLALAESIEKQEIDKINN